MADSPPCMHDSQQANQPKTSTYIFSGPLYLLAVCTDTLVAWRDDLKRSDIDHMINEDVYRMFGKVPVEFQRDIL